MKSTSVTLILALLAVPHLARAADAPPAPPAPAAPAADIGRNAALVYWQVFDQLAQQMKNEAFAKAVNEYSTIPIDDPLRALMKDSVTLQLAAFAANVERCDWGVEMLATEMGAFTLLPHLAKIRELARLVLLDARVRLADKQGAKAADDLIAVYRMGRHSHAGDVLICHLVAVAIEAMANQFLVDHLGSFTDADLAKLRDRIAALPPLPHPSVAIRAEGRTFGGWLKREVVKLKDPKARRDMLALMGVESQLRAMQLILTPADKLTAMIDEVIASYDDIAKVMELPPAEFDKSHEALRDKIDKSNNPFMKLLLPAYSSVYGTYHRSLAQKEITRALIVWRLEGRAKFDAIKDPYGDGPFTVKPTADGLEISSKLIAREQPVMIKTKWKP